MSPENEEEIRRRVRIEEDEKRMIVLEHLAYMAILEMLLSALCFFIRLIPIIYRKLYIFLKPRIQRSKIYHRYRNLSSEQKVIILALTFLIGSMIFIFLL